MDWHAIEGNPKIYQNKAAKRQQTVEVQHRMIMNVIFIALCIYQQEVIKNLQAYGRLKPLHINKSGVGFPFSLVLLTLAIGLFISCQHLLVFFRFKSAFNFSVYIVTFN